MNPVLGFKDTQTDDQSCNYKLVPWINWSDWSFVKDSLFSSSPNSALQRISAWRSRGCLPVVIEITASIVEVQQKDPFFRDDKTDDILHSEEMLAMLYCMAIMRLVNGLVEKTRIKAEVSIGAAADAIGIPRMLIDIRHEGSHRDLPSLRLVRLASVKALDWLKSYYWEAQQMAIPNDKTANLRKEIKSALHELAFCLKMKQTSSSSSPVVKGKRSKKQITKILKKCVRLYTSCPSEVVSLLLEFLLKALDSENSEELSNSSQDDNSIGALQIIYDDWKRVIVKLSNKEPEFLLTLLKSVLEMIETKEAVKYEFGGEQLTSQNRAESSKIEQLSHLFELLVGNLKGLKLRTEVSSTEQNLPKLTLVEFLRRCLLISSPKNNQLISSALALARMTGNTYLVEKLNKLALLHSTLDVNEEILSESFIIKQEDYIRQATAKLDFFKLGRAKSNNVNTNDKWVVAKTWNACPIGMLPCAVRSSGCIPVLDFNDVSNEGEKLIEREEERVLIKCSGKKREAEFVDDLSGKKMKESAGGLESNDKNNDELLKDVEGQLMIGGVWKKVSEEEVIAVASACFGSTYFGFRESWICELRIS